MKRARALQAFRPRAPQPDRLGPMGMRWLGIIIVLVLTREGIAASFDCGKALSPVETLGLLGQRPVAA